MIMETYVYTIDRIPPSNNEFIGRTNIGEYQSQKKEWADVVGWLCRPRPAKTIQYARVTLRYFFSDWQRRDPDNYSGKFILDGLTKMGIIKDDSFFHIKLLSECGGVDPNNPRTEIIIEELDESYFDFGERKTQTVKKTKHKKNQFWCNSL